MSSRESSPTENTDPRLSSKEKILSGDQIVITTNVLYPKYRTLAEGEERSVDDTDGIRGDLALKLIEDIKDTNVRIVVAVHTDSSSDFLSALENRKHANLTVAYHSAEGRAPARRAAFEVATALPNANIIVYTQAEKTSIVNFLEIITQPIREGKADFVIPRRDPELGKRSYPGYMWESEMRVNATYDKLMRRCGLSIPEEGFDWFFGPVVFRNDPIIAALFLDQYELTDEIKSRVGAKPDPEIHSGSHYFPIVHALFLGFRGVGVPIPFIYPPDQKINEQSPETLEKFKNRRAQDASAYRLELLHFLAYLREKPSNIRPISSSPTRLQGKSQRLG